MSSPLQAYGASLALIALNAAKAAGDALAQSVATGIADKVPGVTDVAVADFFDVIPENYRATVRTIFDPAILAAKAAVDTGLSDRIHTGLAIAQATLDTRIAALAATLAATPVAGAPASIPSLPPSGDVLAAAKGLRAV
jgi:hypothetical protein